MAVYNSNSTAQMQNRRSIKSRIEEEEYEEDKNQSDSDFDFSEVFKSVNKPHPSKKPTEKQGIPKDSNEYLLQSQDFETQSEQNRKNKLSLDSETRAELGLDGSPEEFKSGHSPTEAKEKDKSGFVSFDKLVGNSTNLSTNSQNEEAEHPKEVRSTEEEKHYEAPQSEEKKFEEDNLEKWPWDEQVTICNQQIFKNKDFRPKQREIINATKNKEDVIALIPTGGGKSLTFQVSAMTEDGCSIVIMPLLSLIEDQVSQMEELGVPCMFNRTIKDIDKVLRNSKYYKLIFMTPERLVQNKAAQDMVCSLYKDNLLERFVLDEVH